MKGKSWRAEAREQRRLWRKAMREQGRALREAVHESARAWSDAKRAKHDADRAERDAERAQSDAERDADRAERDAERAQHDAERAVERAVRDAERAGYVPKPEHAWYLDENERHRAGRWSIEQQREEWQAEREMWNKQPHRARYLPWWLQSRMRRRIFIWLTLAMVAGGFIGHHMHTHPRWWQIAVGIVILFAASGSIAWRMTRPLLMVVRAARDIGDGKLDRPLDPAAHRGEVRVLATAINDMAAKIQQQIADQRQLLAAVSHELRTPLGHMRVLVETEREHAGNSRALDELEREILVLDDLVGRLLASSRLEFGNLDLRELDLGELVTDAATAANVAPEAIEAIGDVRAAIDPTLVRRAIANLLDNARVHGGGAVAVRIERRAGKVAIEVDDAGPGVPADRRADSFRAFVPSSGGGLGLGLALVSRIAVAHGGGAWIDDRPEGGARIGFSVTAMPAQALTRV